MTRLGKDAARTGRADCRSGGDQWLDDAAGKSGRGVFWNGTVRGCGWIPALCEPCLLLEITNA
jgi:hypothetical protein